MRCGLQTGAAYSRIGLTSDLYNSEKISWFAGPTVLLIIPKTLLALLIVIPIYLFHDKSLEVLDALYSFQRILSKSVIWRGVVTGVRYSYGFTFVGVKCHLPGRSPATEGIKIWLQNGCVSYRVFYLSLNFCVVREYFNFRFDEPEISLMYIRKSIGPRIVPWGVPDITGDHLEHVPRITTRCFLLVTKFRKKVEGFCQVEENYICWGGIISRLRPVVESG